MRLLLDTHALIWWWQGNPRLSERARELIVEGVSVFVSASTAWELATKVRIGKLLEARPMLTGFDERLADQGFTRLPISVAHGLRAGLLQGVHRDPFDRILVAQAIMEDLDIVTNDRAFQRLGARTVW